jgi:Domain of unknown function (DUF4178)
LAELQVNQVECVNCGAKIDIRTGLRMKTFCCEYCGAVCEDDQVVALQNQQELKEKFRPMSFLSLGMKGVFLDQEYQLVGRIRLVGSDDEESWFWDEWFLMSPTGFPLWLVEDENGYTLFRRHVATNFIDPYSPSDTFIIDSKSYKTQERGLATLSFLEGELTWKARPQEVVNYIDLINKDERFSIEYTAKEIQYLRGQKLSINDLKIAFKDQMPPELAAAKEVAPKKEKRKTSWWVLAGIMAILGIIAAVGSYKLSSFGTVVFNKTLSKSVKLDSGREHEFKYVNLSGKPRTFEVKKGPMVAFKFTSSYFPYGSSRNKESGWWLSASLFQVGGAKDGSDKLITVINADFWRAEGYDEGQWSESKMTDTTYIKGLKVGKKYYFEFTSGTNRSNGRDYSSVTRFSTKIIDNAWNPKPIRWFGFGLLGLGIIIMFILAAIKNS